MSHPWPSEDVKLLKREYGKTPTAELAVKLKRTPDTVRRKASQLGVFSPACYPPAVVAKVKALAEKHGPAEIARILFGDSYRAPGVAAVIRKLGLEPKS